AQGIIGSSPLSVNLVAFYRLLCYGRKLSLMDVTSQQTPFMIPRELFLFLASFLCLAVGCSSTPKPSKSSSKPLSGTDEQIFIGDTIEKNYDPNVIMKRAESFFEKEDYPEAIIEYQHFLDLHRVHTLAYYAQYKIAESYFKQIKSVDRDPDPVYKALEAF